MYHWEGGELGKVGEYRAGKVGKIYDWNEVARWEKCMSGVRWNSENRENSEVA